MFDLACTFILYFGIMEGTIRVAGEKPNYILNIRYQRPDADDGIISKRFQRKKLVPDSVGHHRLRAPLLWQMPDINTLILVHNKTLAVQLYDEFKNLYQIM